VNSLSHNTNPPARSSTEARDLTNAGAHPGRHAPTADLSRATVGGDARTGVESASVASVPSRDPSTTGRDGIMSAPLPSRRTSHVDIPECNGEPPEGASEFWSGHRSLDGIAEAEARHWTPAARFCETPNQRANRERRAHRHGKPRDKSLPMPPCAYTVRDARVMVSPEEFAQAWSGWIDRAAVWNWFATLTFKEDVSVDLGITLARRWLARMAEAVRQKSPSTPRLKSALAIEWTCNNRVHIHTVIKAPGLDDHRRLRWQHRWEELGRVCGMARVLPAKEAASAYLGKYLGKGGIITLYGLSRDGMPHRHGARQSRTSRKSDVPQLSAPTGSRKSP
jgi:hypothetical protein